MRAMTRFGIHSSKEERAVRQSRLRSVGILVGGIVLSVAAIGAASAMAALPPGYTVSRIDSPIPTAAGGFGNQAISIGDVDADGKDDIVAVQFNGSAQSSAGIVWEISGATGAVLRTVNAGDPGGVGGNTGADTFLGRMDDIGSCGNAPAQVAGAPGPTCASATVGAKDGVNEILVGLGGVDVAGQPDTGRAYVLDGKTLAILKRIDMPPADRALITARIAENPPAAAGAANAVRGGFGRTVTSPRGLPPCTGNSGIGTCPTDTAMPPAVKTGDLDGGGVPDIIVGANGFPETGTTALPGSNCAATAGATTCVQAGRSYVYRGEDIAGSNPSVILDGTGPGQTPPKVLRALSAQTDDPFNPAGRNENFGHSQFPIGDVGKCTQAGIAPGERCLAANKTIAPDGKPDYVISAHRSDVPIFNPDPAFTETGVSYLYDGATGAILYVYNDPEPVKDALFGFTTGEQFAVGNLGDTALPDVVLAGFQNASNKAQAGRAYVFSGNFTANFINFATMDDPTPNTFGRFGNPTEGVGDLVQGSQVGNEVMVGQFSAVQTPLKDDTDFDVNIMNPANNKQLQNIKDPDAQPESGFGSRVFPMGDLNADGFLDFGVSSVRWDKPAAGADPAVLDAGRVYVFRSDPNAVPPPPPSTTGPAGPAGPGGPGGPAGPTGATGPKGADGTLSLAALRKIRVSCRRARVRRGRVSVRCKVVLPTTLSSARARISASRHQGRSRRIRGRRVTLSSPLLRKGRRYRLAITIGSGGRRYTIHTAIRT